MISPIGDNTDICPKGRPFALKSAKAAEGVIRLITQKVLFHVHDTFFLLSGKEVIFSIVSRDSYRSNVNKLRRIPVFLNEGQQVVSRKPYRRRVVIGMNAYEVILKVGIDIEMDPSFLIVEKA